MQLLCIEEEPIIKIPLKNGGYALVSQRDSDLVCAYKWSLSQGYAVSSVKGMAIGMHRFILGTHLLPKFSGICVDHKDRNRLNNTRSNLRIATPSQNSANCPVPKHSKTSKYKGVSRVSNGKWLAMCRGNYLGIFDSELKAKSVYDKQARKYWGEFAYQTHN